MVLLTAGLTILLPACTATSSTTTADDNRPSLSPAAGERARVDRVVDGDTLVVDGRRVRLIGIDAPESVKPDSPVECYGPQASAELERLLPRRTPVLLEYDVERTDRYGRTLAYVWLTQPLELVNLDLVRDGFATVYTFPPNVRHERQFEAAEAGARAAGRGLWGACER